MKVTIATQHSVHMKQNKGKKITLNLKGGSPYFEYIWINDQCYVLRNGGRTFKIEKVK